MSEEILKSRQEKLTNAELMAKIRQVTFTDFCREADASFDDRWNEWHLTYFSWDYFHYFSRTIPQDQTEKLYQKAFEHLQLIASHQGRMNICGVFLNRKEVEIFSFPNRIYGKLKIDYSEILDKWFWGFDYSYGNGGGGTASSICCNEEVNRIYSGKSREEVLLKGAEHLHYYFTRESSLNEANKKRCLESLENFMTDILGKSSLPIPQILQQKAVAVQGCLF